MRPAVIREVRTRDARFRLGAGEGSDSIHSDPVYSYAVTELWTEGGPTGMGLAFTLGAGTELLARL